MFTVEAAIFDLDGTLIDSTEIYFALLEEACNKLGLPLPPREAVLEFVRTSKGGLRKLFPQEIIKAKDRVIDQATVLVRQMFPRMLHERVSLIRGVDELFHELEKGGIKIGIVTSTHKRFLKEKLQPLQDSGIISFVRSVICVEDIPRFKPEPDPLIECAKRLGVPVNKSLYAGDTYVDIRAGKAAGMKTVAVLTGADSCERLRKENPDLILNSVANLMHMIQHD